MGPLNEKGNAGLRGAEAFRKKRVLFLRIGLSTLAAVFFAGVFPCSGESITKALADGQILSWNLTDGMPDAAENKYFKIAAASFSLEKEEGAERYTMLSWELGFTVKAGVVKAVKIYEIDGDREVLMLEDDSANPADGFWEGKTTPAVISPESTSWLYAEGTTEKIFKFVIEMDSGETSLLYQLALFGPAVKISALSYLDDKKNI